MSHTSFKALCLASLLFLADCAPARCTPSRGSVRRQANQGPDAPVGPPGASDYSSSNPVTSPDTAIPSGQYELAPGQEADEDLGFYLDLSNIDNPQPIRGTPGNAPTDPCPRNRPLERESSDFFHSQGPIEVIPRTPLASSIGVGIHPQRYRPLDCLQRARSDLRRSSQAGDAWFFPAGISHSIQAFAEGVEFLLVFDNGAFSEDETFLLSVLIMRNPRSVLAKDLRVDPYDVPGGSVKILDTVSFPIAKNFVKQGQPCSRRRSSRTFDFQAGDVGYVPTLDAHYLENTGDADLVYLEILQAPLNRLPMVKPDILPGSTDKTEMGFRQKNL
ncbi:hypothetical protein KVT40_006719 [Elsinoe batatas]|uniref:Cupin type-1 domain-containing protein n=1 Tax=Elsinoe batatas TaxID=2601811 RepID=A0A8K0L372_9PEZI|nr:hypothetical protein KVT40_006719 [Elsinoe batatas]